MSHEIKCKCVICGAKRTFTERDLIDEMGPMCEKCLGPMIVEKVEVRQSQANRGTKL